MITTNTQYIMENLSDSLLTNIQGTHIVFEACKKNNKEMYVSSSLSVAGAGEMLRLVISLYSLSDIL